MQTVEKVETDQVHGADTLEERAAEGARNFLEMMVQKVGTGGTSMVFGQPVERGSVTVIPVARAMWGVGGGSGPEEKHEQKTGTSPGTGGGGGVMIVPVGYIELTNGRSRFRPIFTFSGLVPFLLVTGMITLRILKYLKRA